MGYDDLSVPDSAFERDTKWEQMEEFVERLGATAAELGLGFGVKFSNTLIVQNHRDFFPSGEKEMYLSGQPLHVLAMNLVGRFRRRFGTRFPISFAAGIDRTNFADAVALGLVPVTVCTDLLRPGGYARAGLYLKELGKRMRAAGAATVDEWVLRAYGREEEARRRAGDSGDPVAEAALLNTKTYVEQVTADPRYHRDANRKVPKKIGRRLQLFDCITCDKCVPVCPNDANFTFDLPKQEIPILKMRRDGDAWKVVERSTLKIEERHQIGNFADFCNDCGNCDVFCPEDGGPYAIKPRFFGSLQAWEQDGGDGFFLGRSSDGSVMIFGRFGGRGYRLEMPDGGPTRYCGDSFEVAYDPADLEGTIAGDARGDVDLGYAGILGRVAQALSAHELSWAGAMDGSSSQRGSQG
jgi:putative selenate reductase